MAEKNARRRYSLATAICLIMGICIGSGIFFKSDNVLVATGGSIGAGVVMFCLAATYIVFGGLCLTLFAARTDGAGGLVDYAERFVSPRFARLIALHYAFVYLPSISAVIFWVAGVYACMVLGLPGTLAQQMGIGLALMLACSIVNALAPRLSGWSQNALTVVKVAPLLAVGLVGLVAVLSGRADAGGATVPSAGPGGLAWLAAAAPIAFSFDGWPAATSIAPELRRAQRNLPIALVAAPLAILALYLAYFVGLSVTLGPAAVMEAGDGSLALLFSRLFGERAAAWPNLIAFLAVLGTGNGLVLSLQRLPQALAARGDLPGGRRLVRESGTSGATLLGAGLSTLCMLAWSGVHALVQAGSLIPNGDVSEVSVCLAMLLMLPYFAAAWHMRRDGRAGILRGRVAPVLATACCLFVGLSGLAEPVRLAFAALELVVLLALTRASGAGRTMVRRNEGEERHD